ncbi:uncharacterized protein LOC123542895 [Mercenaria mercenaria]|uniref:uncharacterized protein LOC123542895 n=1 Tax=Mercenaria mercenaria TaxID=6596 RepID=UPI00234F521D|nr:uncharacterized protein LOC123542895 [Mercenaria mercenaria]
MYMYLVQIIALAVMIIGTASQTPHGKDTSICTTIQPSSFTPAVQKPNITNQFQCRVEIVLRNKNKTGQMHEYFDDVNNRGYIHQTDMDVRFDAWYDYGTNEFIGYYPDAPASMPGRCFVQDLSTSSQRLLFGYSKTGPGGTGHIFSAAKALRFSGQGINEVYMGRTVVRDIQVDWWRSCQYWDSMDATMIVDWYFTAQNTWNSAVGIQVPVQAHVKGISYQNGKHNFEHYYNFFDFIPYLDATEKQVFETPSGLQCPGRKLTKAFPTVPQDAFSFTTEVLETTNMTLSFMKETYYYSQKLVMFEYTPQTDDFSPYGMHDLIEIHDFNTGVAYVTDRARGNCSYRPIEISDFDDRTSGPNTVRIRNSREFFYLDVKNVSYEGVKNNRGIDCDSWVAVRSDFPFSLPTNTTWEWYFATTEWNYINAGQENGKIPVQMRVTYPKWGLHYQYSIYNFKKSKPDLLKFDISSCYEFEQRRKFQFMLQATDAVKDEIRTNDLVFKYYVLQSIISTTGVSPIRVANLQVLVAEKVCVTFEILDVAPNIGDGSTPHREAPLDFAASTLASMIQNNQFVVTLSGGAFKYGTYLQADPQSLIEITYSNATTPAITTEGTTEATVTSQTPSTASKMSSSSISNGQVTSKSVSVSSKPSTSTVKPKPSTASSKSKTVSPQTGGQKTTGTGQVEGSKPQSSDKSTRALSIAGVVIGSIIAAVLAVLLVVYLKRSGRIRVRGQNSSAGIDNVAYSSAKNEITNTW